MNAQQSIKIKCKTENIILNKSQPKQKQTASQQQENRTRRNRARIETRKVEVSVNNTIDNWEKLHNGKYLSKQSTNKAITTQVTFYKNCTKFKNIVKREYQRKETQLEQISVIKKEHTAKKYSRNRYSQVRQRYQK